VMNPSQPSRAPLVAMLVRTSAKIPVCRAQGTSRKRSTCCSRTASNITSIKSNGRISIGADRAKVRDLVPGSTSKARCARLIAVAQKPPAAKARRWLRDGIGGTRGCVLETTFGEETRRIFFRRTAFFGGCATGTRGQATNLSRRLPARVALLQCLHD